ncbi:MAG: hypothetical protein WED05_10035 [Candidatus Atabeyarchaeum deiterrae]
MDYIQVVLLVNIAFIAVVFLGRKVIHRKSKGGTSRELPGTSKVKRSLKRAISKNLGVLFLCVILGFVVLIAIPPSTSADKPHDYVGGSPIYPYACVGGSASGVHPNTAAAVGSLSYVQEIDGQGFSIRSIGYGHVRFKFNVTGVSVTDDTYILVRLKLTQRDQGSYIVTWSDWSGVDLSISGAVYWHGSPDGVYTTVKISAFSQFVANNEVILDFEGLNVWGGILLGLVGLYWTVSFDQIVLMG